MAGIRLPPILFALCISCLCLSVVQADHIEKYTPKGTSGNGTSPSQLMPLPFVRPLFLSSPPMQGNDVTIMQTLLMRSSAVQNLKVTGIFDINSSSAVQQFQSVNGLPNSGTFDALTAQQLLNEELNDGYVDSGTVPAGYLYKVFIPVFVNRSIETTGKLIASNNTVLYQFITRTQGQSGSNGQPLNELTTNGQTPTGLMTFDLNSPEGDVIDYGPYPINRAVSGLEGNGFIINGIRSGILMHTGVWPLWNESMPMPNSHGCIHVHPHDCDEIQKILVSIGVQIRPNTEGKLPYPYQPQGLLSIQLMPGP